MKWKVKIHRKAYQELERIHPKYKNQILKKIHALAENPYVGEKLHGEWQGFRKIRVGDYRIVYTVEEEVKILFIVKIGHRKDVYK